MRDWQVSPERTVRNRTVPVVATIRVVVECNRLSRLSLRTIQRLRMTVVGVRTRIEDRAAIE